MRNDRIALLMVLMMLLLGCVGVTDQAKRKSETLPFAFEGGKVGKLEISASGYVYTRGNLQLSLADAEGRFSFYVRELAEAGVHKPPFNSWLGSGEFARILDSENKANIYLLLLKQETPEVTVQNVLRFYTANAVYRVESRNRDEFVVSDDISAVKEVYDLDINGTKRRIAFGYLRVSPNTMFWTAAWNRGLYNASEPEQMIRGILSTIKIQR